MSDNDVNAHSGGPAAAPAGGRGSSRRAKRAAERAAEREAYITGQQPLLTRRELKRLREEAEALRAAVAAGEITPEEARALQNPLLEEGGGLPASSARSGARTPSPRERGRAGIPGRGGPAPAARPAPRPVAAPPARPVPAAGQPTRQVPVSGRASAAQQSTRPVPTTGRTPVVREARRPASPARPPPPSRPLPGRSGAQAPARPATHEDPVPGRTQPVSRPVPTPWEPLRAVSPVPAAGGHGIATRREPAPPSSAPAAGGHDTRPHHTHHAPTPSSPDTSGRTPGRKGRLSQVVGATTSATKLSDSQIEEISAVSTGLLPAAEAQDEPVPLSPPSAESADPADAVVPARRSLMNRLATDAPESAGTDRVPAPAPATPSRRPIVRIPSGVQGVRTVDHETGVLQNVQPVDAEFDGLETPQWRALHDSIARKDAARGAATGAAAPAPAPAPEPEAVFPDEEVFAEESVTNLEVGYEPEGGSRLGHYLLIGLLILVLLLVLGTVAWYVVTQADSNAAATGVSTPLLL